MPETMTTIDPNQVSAIFEECLLREEDNTAKHVEAKGITLRAFLHRGRLEQHRESISEMLKLLPIDFQSTALGGGDGASFLEACKDVHGNQWTELHRIMEQLMLLGIATDEAEYVLPREMWGLLPLQMPYFRVT